MTIEFIEGFDLVGTVEELQERGWYDTPATSSLGSGRFSVGSSLLTSNILDSLTVSYPFVRYTTISYWFRYSNVTNLNMVTIEADLTPTGFSTSAIHCLLAHTVTGELTLTNHVGVQGTSAVNTILIDTWHHIELQVDSDNLGFAKVYVDGILALEVLGTDFFYTTTAASIKFFSPYSEFDDIVIQRGSVVQPIINEHRIHTLLPGADTAQADWSGSFSDIDDPFGSADGDITYISTATINNKSEFDVGDLSESPTMIHAVQSAIEARKTDAGTKGVTHYIDSNGNREDGTEFAAAETYGVHTKMHELNPDGSVAWTEATVNALKVGVEITT